MALFGDYQQANENQMPNKREKNSLPKRGEGTLLPGPEPFLFPKRKDKRCSFHLPPWGRSISLLLFKLTQFKEKFLFFPLTKNTMLLKICQETWVRFLNDLAGALQPKLKEQDFAKNRIEIPSQKSKR